MGVDETRPVTSEPAGIRLVPGTLVTEHANLRDVSRYRHHPHGLKSVVVTRMNRLQRDPKSNIKQSQGIGNSR